MFAAIVDGIVGFWLWWAGPFSTLPAGGTLLAIVALLTALGGIGFFLKFTHDYITEA